MTPRSSIRQLFASRTLRQAPARRPVLEALEDRTLLNFHPAVHYGAGVEPSSVAAGDFNGDGRLDLAVANYGDAPSLGTLSVLRNNGNGTFQPHGTYPLGTNPNFVAVGEFNGDGRLDLALANTYSNNVSVLLGSGDGSFQGAVNNYAVATLPTSVAVGDFNGDGRQDLVTANFASASVSVLRGNGDGTFQSAVHYAGQGARSVAVGDFNGDGRPDLVTANSGSVSVLLGNGDGTFANASHYYASATHFAVAVGDFNGDGRPDLVTANLSTSASVWLGNGNGTFQTAVSFAVGNLVYDVAVGDFNGDGRLDLALADLTANSVRVCRGNGDGTFQAAVSFGVGQGPLRVAVGDLTGEGLPDLAVANKYSNNVSVLLNNGPNNPPVISRDLAAVTVNEGSLATNSGTFDDAQGRHTVRVTASVGTVTQNTAAGTWSWSYTPPDGPAGPTTVTVTATDGGGLSASTTFTLTVRNVAPTITTITVPAATKLGGPVALSAAATDPAGTADPLTFTWTVTLPNLTTFTFTGASASFTPTVSGRYGVSLAVSDGDGGSTSLPASGLVSWWKGEGNASDVRNFHHGTPVGGVTFAPGLVGRAFRFDGNSRVEVADAPGLDLTSAATLEAWVKPSSLAFPNGFGAVLVKGAGTARNYGLFVRSDGGLHLSYFTTGGANVQLDTAANLIPVGQFSHVAALLDPAAGLMQIYRNWQLVASRTPAGPLVANTAPLTIGYADGFGFRGLIDEPSVYNRALSPIELQSIVNVGSAGKPSWVTVVDPAAQTSLVLGGGGRAPDTGGASPAPGLGSPHSLPPRHADVSGPEVQGFSDTALLAASGSDRYFAEVADGTAGDLLSGLGHDELVEGLGILAV